MLAFLRFAKAPRPRMPMLRVVVARLPVLGGFQEWYRGSNRSVAADA